MNNLVDQVVRFRNVKGRWLIVEDYGWIVGAQKIIPRGRGGIPIDKYFVNEMYRTFAREEIV